MKPPVRFLRSRSLSIFDARSAAFQTAALTGAAFLGAASLAAVPAPASAADGLSSIRLTATPPVVRADGHSTTYINAEVYDAQGNFAPDGTRVRFSTTGSSARLESGVATTKNGVARVLLTAPNQPGETFVAATVEGSGQSVPVQIKIAFTLDADAAETGVTWARIEGRDYLGYSADISTVQANGKNGTARFTYRTLDIKANTYQFNAQDNSILASGDVVLTSRGTERKYNTLRYNTAQSEGVGERIEDGKPVYYHIRGNQADETAFTNGEHIGENDFLPFDISESRTVIVAKSISLEPNRRLQFRRATFYLDGQKTISFPFHVMALGQSSLFENPLFGYGYNGLSVDLPFYYDVRTTGIGTLHARRGARIGDSSAFATRQGWSIDALQSYNGAHRAEGSVELVGINRTDWAARFRHGQQLDKITSGSVYLDFPGGSRGLFASSQATRTYSEFNLNGSLSVSRAPGVTDVTTGQKGQAYGDIRGQFGATTREKPLWGSQKTPVRYTLTTDFSRLSDYGKGGVTGVSQGIIYTNTTGAQFFTNPLNLNRATSVSQSVSLGQTWVRASTLNAQAEGISLLGTTSLNRSFGSLGSGTLSYNYSQTPLYKISNANAIANGRQRLDLTSYLTGNKAKWNLTLNASQGIDSPQQTLFSKLDFALGGPWRGHVRLSTSRLGGVSYKETEYALFRRILGRDFGVYYSTSARRFQLDLSRIGF